VQGTIGSPLAIIGVTAGIAAVLDADLRDLTTIMPDLTSMYGSAEECVVMIRIRPPYRNRILADSVD
jgi:hypothetical protein